MMAIEAEFGIMMNDAEADALNDVPGTVDFLINHPYVVSYEQH